MKSNFILIELSDLGEEKLLTLMKEYGIKNKKEFLNYALSVFEWVLKENNCHRIIFSDNNEGNDKKIFRLPEFS